MTMPHKIQPGELASSMSFSAPVSLLLFVALVFVLARLRSLDIHPVNYLMIAAAFFSFHLLFSYLVDQVHVGTAFALASVVSVVLVTSYMRLVVSARFAFVEAAIAQLVYLVGFSLAHFWQGMTGLTVTVLSIATLFVLMQLTGRVRWGSA
jgi:inner membrane protein